MLKLEFSSSPSRCLEILNCAILEALFAPHYSFLELIVGGVDSNGYDLKSLEN